MKVYLEMNDRQENIEYLGFTNSSMFKKDNLIFDKIRAWNFYITSDGKPIFKNDLILYIRYILSIWSIYDSDIPLFIPNRNNIVDIDYYYKDNMAFEDINSYLMSAFTYNRKKDFNKGLLLLEKVYNIKFIIKE